MKTENLGTDPGATPTPMNAAAVTGEDVASFKAFEAQIEAGGEPKVEAPTGAELPKTDEAKAAEAKAAAPAPDAEKPVEAVTADKPVPEGDKPAAKKSAAERIGELRRKSGDAERALEAERARNAELAAENAALKSGKKVTPETEQTSTTDGDTDPEPTPDDKNADGTDKYAFGELDKKFTKDLAAHSARQVIAAERKKDSDTRQQQAAREAAEAEEGKIADFLEAGAARHADFVEKVFEGRANYPLSAETWELLQESDARTDIAYHFATNPAEAQKFHDLSPVGKARELVKLEARFPSGAQPPNGGKPTNKIPLADAPVPQPRGVAGQFAASDATPDFKAFEAKWQPKLDAGV